MVKRRRLVATIVVIVGLGLSGGCSAFKPASPDTLFDQTADRFAQQWPSHPLAGEWTTAFIPLQPATIVPTGGPQPLPIPSTAASIQDPALAKVGVHVSFTISGGVCDTKLKARVYETKTAVVIGASFTPYRGADACTAQGIVTPVSVTLSAPLGTRALLDVGNGYPAVVGASNLAAIT